MRSRRAASALNIFVALAVVLTMRGATAQEPAPPIENQAAPVEQPESSPGAAEVAELGLPAVAQTTVPEAMPAMPTVIDLAKAQEVALLNNPSLQAADARIRQARARVRQAVSAYFPQVDTSFTATRANLAENVLKTSRQAAFNAPLAPLQSQLQQVLAGQASLGDPATFVPQALRAGAAAITARNAVPEGGLRTRRPGSGCARTKRRSTRASGFFSMRLPARFTTSSFSAKTSEFPKPTEATTSAC
jgi:hypothetical protein